MNSKIAIDLKGKTAVLYGVSESLAGTVAETLAAAGAKVFLTARRLTNAREIADKISAAKGQAEADEVDALDEQAINSHLKRILEASVSLDVSFNLIDIRDVQGTPLVDMSLEEFVRPVRRAMHTQCLTATAAGRIMSKQGSGVILSLTATPGGTGYPMVDGFGPACCAIEAFSRNLAAELGPYGVRAINIRSAGSPDSRPFREITQKEDREAQDFL